MADGVQSDIKEGLLERLEENVTVENIVGQLNEALPSKEKSEDESSEEESLTADLEWKRYLSGALSDEQLYLAMIVLLVFYCAYVIYNAYSGDINERDEGEIIQNCTCKDSDRNFYLALSVMCLTTWFVCHSCYTLATAFPAVTKSLKQKIIIQVLNCVGYFRIYTKNDDESDDSDESSAEKKLKKMIDQQIAQCDKFLWSQYYEIYAVGIKKRDKPLNVKETEELIAKSLSPEIRKKECLSTEYSKEITDNGNQKFHKFSYVKRISLGVFHAFLVAARFLAQLSVVPLLLMLMFDTYTLLCLAHRDYCDVNSQYKLHLDKTALIFSFYCGLMISLLVTAWINLVPWPKLEVFNCQHSYNVHVANPVTDI